MAASNAPIRPIATSSPLPRSARGARRPPQPIIVPEEPILIAFARRTERAGASFSLFDTGVSLNYTRVKLPAQDVRIAGASLHRSVGRGVTLWANGYKDLGDRNDYGVFAGISLTFGKSMTASSSVAKRRGATSLLTRISRNPGSAEGSVGWDLVSSETLSGGGGGYRSANIRYLGHSATVGGSIESDRGAIHGTAFAEGSLVVMGGGVFLSPQIDSSFAIVRGAGAHTPILSNTRRVAHTDASGRGLVPYLNSLEPNLIAIDPTDLPVDLKPARTEAWVIPADRGGVIVDFGVTPVDAAIVILVDAAGEPLPVGALVRVEGQEDEAVVGYDGRAYLTGLAQSNRVRVERGDAPACTASFAFTPLPRQQPVIGPVPCQ